MQQFIPLPLLDDKGQPVSGPELAWRHRLNGFGSSYYFTRTILKRRRLTPALHLPICLSLEKDHLKDVKEYPRDHFKSTIACEGMPIWRVLPFGDRDEEMFRKYHTSGVFTHTALDEFCRWQRKIHNPHLRNLLISETDKNARKLGTRIRRHFESNAIFRTFYPEIIPTSAERWTDCSLQIHVPGGTAPHGEGTFDFVGVGGALQSNHYNGLLIQDDLVGRKAIESASVMDKTIEYHQLLVGVFDDDDRDHESDELVIGNRWGFADVNSYIREHEPWFHIESHSAMGGCCGLHPAGQPIFPEEFSEGKLMKLKMRLGTYNFSCQFMNSPVSPEDADFKEDWLGHYQVVYPGAATKALDGIIQHTVKDGVIRKDIPINQLKLAIATDPTHSQNAGNGRCRHSIVVVGMSDVGNYYLLDCWAESCSFEHYFAKVFELSKRWGLHRVGFETCAGQGLGAYHIQYYAGMQGYRLSIVELKGEVELADGTMSHKKEFRIRDVLSPLCEFGRFFTPVGRDGKDRFQDFLSEYCRFPKGITIDILDALAYIPQMLRNPINAATAKQMRRLNKQMANLIGQPYSVGVGKSSSRVM